MEGDKIYWEKRKHDILESIDQVLEKGSENEDILEIMKELVNNIKVTNTMTDYYGYYNYE